MRFDARLDRLELRHEFGMGKQPEYVAGTLRLDTGKLTRDQIAQLTRTLGGYLTVVIGVERFEKAKAKR